MHSATVQDVLGGVQIGYKGSPPARTHRKKPHDSAVQSAATSDLRLLCIRFGHGTPPSVPERISGTLVESDLDEVRIGVAHVEAADSATGACPLDGAELHGDRLGGKMLTNLVDRAVSNQTQVRAPRDGLRGMRSNRIVRRMEVDLLVPEAQCRSPMPEGDDLHAQNPRIEVDACLDGVDRQNDVVNAGDTHRAIVPDTLGLTAVGQFLTEGRTAVEHRLAGTRFDTRTPGRRAQFPHDLCDVRCLTQNHFQEWRCTS